MNPVGNIEPTGTRAGRDGSSPPGGGALDQVGLGRVAVLARQEALDITQCSLHLASVQLFLGPCPCVPESGRNGHKSTPRQSLLPAPAVPRQTLRWFLNNGSHASPP